jgi:signal transduction histidine kinase
MIRPSAKVFDVVVAVAFTAALVIEFVLTESTALRPAPVSIALALVVGASLVVRRRVPLLAYAVGSAALVSSTLWSGPSAILPYANLFGLFSLGLYGSRRRALFGPVIMVPGVLIYFSTSASDLPIVTGSVLVVWGSVWVMGYQLARSREQAQATSEAQKREAMADERVRIARELHDVVGHTVNVMLVQAGATRLVMDADPAKATELLTSIEASARQALGELDQLLGLLRDDAETVTQTGLRELPALVGRLADAGLAVTLEVSPVTLPPQVDIVAYRIVQEALTNSLRHGSATAATVRITVDERLVIEVTDNGHGVAGYSPGRGLRGMAERAALFDGTVEHGFDTGGFRVRAELGLP